MKKMILPQLKPDYIPKGIYSLPKEERRSAFEKMLSDNQEIHDLTDYRMNALKQMRGEL